MKINNFFSKKKKILPQEFHRALNKINCLLSHLSMNMLFDLCYIYSKKRNVNQ